MSDLRSAFVIFVLLHSSSNKLQAYGCVRTVSPEEISCPAQNVVNGVVSYSPDTDTHFEETEATYTCNDGFVAQGTPRIVCLANGQWSGALGTCERQCGLLTTTDPFADVIVYNPTTRLEGSIAILTCMDGFAVLGNEQRICQADGTFSDAFGTCQAVCADYPEDDPNANPIIYDQTPHFLTSGITRTCMPGFVIVQPNEANCIENPAGSNTLDWDMMLGLCAPAGK